MNWSCLAKFSQWVGVTVDVTAQRAFWDVAFVEIAAEVVQGLNSLAAFGSFLNS